MKIIGEGKYSKVKLAQDINNPDILVAIKVVNLRRLRIRDSISPLSRNSSREIAHEIKLLQDLEHPNIIKLIEHC